MSISLEQHISSYNITKQYSLISLISTKPEFLLEIIGMLVYKFELTVEFRNSFREHWGRFRNAN